MYKLDPVAPVAGFKYAVRKIEAEEKKRKHIIGNKKPRKVMKLYLKQHNKNSKEGTTIITPEKEILNQSMYLSSTCNNLHRPKNGKVFTPHEVYSILIALNVDNWKALVNDWIHKNFIPHKHYYAVGKVINKIIKKGEGSIQPSWGNRGCSPICSNVEMTSIIETKCKNSTHPAVGREFTKKILKQK